VTINTLRSATFLAGALTLMSTAAWAGKSCEDLKAEIDAKLQAKGVKSYTLDVVPTDAIKDQKVVGSCEGGAKKIVYTRGSPAAASAAPAT
jgi:hypothetical protein